MFQSEEETVSGSKCFEGKKHPFMVRDGSFENEFPKILLGALQDISLDQFNLLTMSFAGCPADDIVNTLLLRSTEVQERYGCKFRF